MKLQFDFGTKKPNAFFPKMTKPFLAYFLYSLLLSANFTYSQSLPKDEFEKGRLLISIKDSSAVPTGINIISSSVTTNNSSLNQIYDVFKVTSCIRAYPTAKTKRLQAVYEISCNGGDQLINELQAFPELFNYVERKPRVVYDGPPPPPYTPNDYNNHQL